MVPAKSSFFLISRNRSRSPSAFSVTCFSWPRQVWKSPPRKRSPVWPVAPIRMFSMTESLASTLVSWKVRIMPIRATR